MSVIKKSSLACAVIGALLIAGCGSSSSSSTGAGAAGGSAASSSSSSAAGGSAANAGNSSTSGSGGSGNSGAGALSADAHSAATGDIPDNQVFLVYSNRTAGFSMKYPEGWTQSGHSHRVTFRDKNNLVRVLIAPGSSPTTASVTKQLTALKTSNPSLTFQPPQTLKMGSNSVIKAVYTTKSAPDPVTGKRVKLIVDRYELARGHHVATVDLGTPVGVDNVDDYRMMIESFQWR